MNDGKHKKFSFGYVELFDLQVEVSSGCTSFLIPELKVEVWARRSRLRGRNFVSNDGT